MQKNTGYYIISPNYALRGWAFLPYALQSLQTTKTFFFRKPEFELLKKCDGNTHISLEELSEEEKDLLAR